MAITNITDKVEELQRQCRDLEIDAAHWKEMYDRALAGEGKDSCEKLERDNKILEKQNAALHKALYRAGEQLPTLRGIAAARAEIDSATQQALIDAIFDPDCNS